ncbi:2-oxo acid dehydrogenase subunit E2 [Baekduia soli]|uniref:2-oxo acid dehydrogenase subunit E2 n=1 Tax=Baekduia soli TaxID=496014 RepID=A0A5B8U5E9_9ACTN|nr:2-oxo acid dehydrogenase subunit E2 [Baekduia soli]QEC48105.1 2-oxo acid dehydrogenase subunit E2 [Baekduia soli]
MTQVAAPTGRGEPEVRKLSLMRRAMARRMVEASAVPCFYLRVTADATALIAARAQIKASGVTPVPSINDFIVLAVGRALRAHPHVNASWGDNTVEVHPRVNVGVAVAVEGGLVVPAVYDTDRLDVHGVAAAVREVAGLANARKLGRELLEDATFTVSNLGMFGIEDFDPIINPPQAAILGVGTVTPDAAGRQAMRLTLGCDHRVLTGAEGAPFLVDVKERLQDPDGLLAAGPDPSEEGAS